DVVTAFGLIHHLPSFELRQQLVEALLNLIRPGGVLILAAWQFMTVERLKEKVINPQTLSLNPADLEPRDYILDWERGAHSYRYCHWVTPEELQQLLQPALSQKR